jgi:hypothetical protein
MDGLFAGSVSWFPQEYAEAFYLLKGALALIGTVLLVVHMLMTWSSIERWGQRLRYLVLLGFAGLASSSTVEQVQQSAVVSYRNLAAAPLAVLLILAMVVSIHDDLTRKP